MRRENFEIGGAPALLLGERTDKLYLFIHGQSGCKEEAEAFAPAAASRGYQVLGIDLPEHGGRGDGARLTPWEAVPELSRAMEYARANYKSVSIRANSIGAWPSMMAFAKEPIDKCLFVSPIPDMQRLICRMMEWAGVSDARLKAEGEIATSFGQTLSWEYLTYVRKHPITSWPAPTVVLYAGRDDLVEREGIEAFARRFGCELSVMEDGEHWFHTPRQLAVLDAWTQKNI